MNNPPITTHENCPRLHTSRDVVKFRRGIFTKCRVRGDAPEGMVECVSDPEKALSEATILKDRPSRLAGIARLPDGSGVFIKRYNYRGFIYLLKNMFRRSRVDRNRRIGRRMEICGLPVPKVYGTAIKRVGPLLLKSYIFLETIENTISPEKWVKRLLEDQTLFDEYCRQFFDTLVRMHKNGMRHTDLKVSNIYCHEVDGGHLKFGVWDFDAIWFSPTFHSEKELIKALARHISSWILTAETFNMEVKPSELSFNFVRQYFRASSIRLPQTAVNAEVNRFLSRKNSSYVL
jgi:tRNA A-37 threonylcarbamoyl transferase component Bud32